MAALHILLATAFPFASVAWRFAGVVRREARFLPAAGRARR
jgi:hypothetical protein